MVSTNARVLRATNSPNSALSRPCIISSHRFFALQKSSTFSFENFSETSFCLRRNAPWITNAPQHTGVGWMGRKINFSATQLVRYPTMNPKTGSKGPPDAGAKTSTT